MDINAGALIKYDHLDKEDVESGEEKLQLRFPLDCLGHFLSCLEERGELVLVLIRSNNSYGETVTNVRLLC